MAQWGASLLYCLSFWPGLEFELGLACILGFEFRACLFLGSNFGLVFIEASGFGLAFVGDLTWSFGLTFGLGSYALDLVFVEDLEIELASGEALGSYASVLNFGAWFPRWMAID